VYRIKQYIGAATNPNPTPKIKKAIVSILMSTFEMKVPVFEMYFLYGDSKLIPTRLALMTKPTTGIRPRKKEINSINLNFLSCSFINSSTLGFLKNSDPHVLHT
jgi:hypothetical protein